MAETKESSIKPPYLSYTTLKNFLGNFKEGVIPSRVDKSLMPGQSGATQSYILSSLQFFQLIDDKGVPKPALQSLISAIGDESAYRDAWKVVFLAGYDPIISGLDLAKATPDELKERFKPFSYGGDTLRKCHVFFIAAAEAAGVALAPHLKVAGRASPASKRSNGKKSSPATSQEQPPSSPVKHHHKVPEGMIGASLPLNRDGSRFFSVEAPTTITSEELKRIQSWLSFQLIVSDVVDDV